MELKDYQQGVLRKLDHYLATLAEKHDDARAFVEFQRGRGKKVAPPDYCRDAWDALNQEGRLPWLRDRNGDTLVAPWLSRHDGLQRGIPNICLKVPTGGGKTLLATASLERIQTDYFKRQTGLVLWVVPSDAIYRQTWKQLANREHPYRQMLERASGGRVKLLEKTDAFTRQDVADQLCIMLLMLPSAARKSKETLRLFRDSGRFTSFFPPEDDSTANRELLDTVPNLDLNDLADMGFAEGIVPGSLSIRQSLGNVLRLLRVVVIDEGHKAYSDTARDTLCGFNPRFVLELSATPNAGGKHQSNVLVNVPGTDLKDEEMIKLPINVINEDRGGWKHTLTLAHDRLADLQRETDALQTASGRYIRPILLVRVERTGKDQRDSAFVHAEDAREYLITHLGVAEDAIRLKTSESDELGDDDLLANTCPVRYIITKDALREGWDCPFAYVLAILSRTTANTALTQMIGRVLRQPHARLTRRPALDQCYVFTLHFVVDDRLRLDTGDKLRRTLARIDLDRPGDGPEQVALSLQQEAQDELPEEGLDIPFLVRQLLEVIPNPWQGMRILDETLAALRAHGLDEQRLYANRLELLRLMKLDLGRQVQQAGEALFRSKLESGDIALRLVASRDPRLNWALAETLEIQVSNEDRELYRQDGDPLRKSLFDKVYQRDLNSLEKHTAWYLDASDSVYWWHRIAVGSYGLQGWQRQRVYPDLLACLHGTESDRFRFSVLETKGKHLKGNDDTEYKRRLFELLTRHADTAVRAGALILDADRSMQGITFTLLMEDSWKQELAAAGVGYRPPGN